MCCPNYSSDNDEREMIDISPMHTRMETEEEARERIDKRRKGKRETIYNDRLPDEPIKKFNLVKRCDDSGFDI